MKKLTGLLAAVALMMLSAAPLYAQKKEMSTMDLLKNGVWEVQNEFKDRPRSPNQPYDRTDSYSTFSDSTWDRCSISGKKVSGNSLLYYLSNEIVEKKDFDDSKIGKVKNGKYIVSKTFYGPEEEGAFRVITYEIIKLDDKEVVLLQTGIVVGEAPLRLMKTDKKLWINPKTGKALIPPAPGKWVSYSIE